MTRYALNSAVITGEGLFRYRLLTPEEAREWWDRRPVDPRIGYPETCTALARVLGLGTVLEVGWRTCRMEPGDEAFVFKLARRCVTFRLGIKRPITLPSDKRLHEVRDADYEIGLLERVE